MHQISHSDAQNIIKLLTIFAIQFGFMFSAVGWVQELLAHSWVLRLACVENMRVGSRCKKKKKKSCLSEEQKIIFRNLRKTKKNHRSRFRWKNVNFFVYREVLRQQVEIFLARTSSVILFWLKRKREAFKGRNSPHLKHPLWNLCPPATRSSAA